MTAALSGRRAPALLAALAGCAALLGLPAVARAADTYVDDDSGNDANPCTMAAPCKTISAGIGATEPGYAVHVDGGFYGESVTLSGDRSLVEDEFNAGDGDSQATIDGGVTHAIEVPAAGEAGVIARFTVRSDATAIVLKGPATVAANLFDDKTESAGLRVEAGADGSVVSNNTFADGPGETDLQTGVEVINPGAATVTGNTFHDLVYSVWVANGTPTVAGNTITGTRKATSSAGAAIHVFDADPTIVANVIRSPAHSGTEFGVLLTDPPGPPSAGATMRRNEIHDFTDGVRVINTTAPVTLDGDLIVGSSGIGLLAYDEGTDDAGVADVTATNLTAFDNKFEITTGATHLTLDSSIVGPGGLEGFAGVCAISFSRGPLISPGGNGCGDFQTTAAPLFANPVAGDYHLTAGSPLLDAGNPADPGPGALDLDGDPRALDATPACDGIGDVPRRDIGADELVPAPLCAAPISLPLLTGSPRLAIARLRQSHRRWRRGRRRAKVSSVAARRKGRRPPLGTTFTFRLNKRARVRFAFARKRGRGGKRFRKAGALTFAGHRGRNRVKFQGRLSRRRWLKPGRYRLTATAKSGGVRSKPRSLRFRIVK